MKFHLLSLLLFFSLTSGAQEKDSLTYVAIVERLTDLKALAELPEPGESSEMWSSYDRKSKIDSATGEFINWEANDDGLTPQFIRKEGEQEVLAEMEGPGAIVRIWSASPREGKVRIYVDGSSEPVIALPFIEYFKPVIPAFDFPQLVYETSARGFNNYVPITYQKSLKIVADPGWGQYYHFNYISFPEGTLVEKFNPEMGGKNLKALQQVNNFFENYMGQYPYYNAVTTENLEEKVAPGEEKVFYESKKAGAITSFKVKLKIRDKQKMAEILRKLVLKMKWDGEKEPSVWSPLGDFFGTSPGWNEYKTLPMGMTDEWMYSYWYMPFKDGAEIAIKNDFNEDVQVEIELKHEELGQEVGDLARFHAKWHRDLSPLKKSRWPDWTLLETQGRGRFVGTHLLVWNPKGGSCSAAGPGQHWWGEGDEKFFVDGEKFPSTFGTGTEDYFGYAWCDPSKFEHAFHSQTLDNDNMGYQPMNRWHIIDNIPFQESFNGYVEKYFPNHWPTQYSVVVYWYLNAEGEDNIAATPVEERFGFETPYVIFREEGVVEGELLEIKNNSGGWASPDVWAHESLYDEVSGHKVLIWHGEPRKENTLNLNFDWPEAGNYKVEVNTVNTRDGGNFDLIVNDELKKSIDFKTTKEVGDTQKVELGTIKLQPGPQNIQIKWTGKEEEIKAMRIDYIRLEKID